METTMSIYIYISTSCVLKACPVKAYCACASPLEGLGFRVQGLGFGCSAGVFSTLRSTACSALYVSHCHFPSELGAIQNSFRTIKRTAIAGTSLGSV